MKIPAIWRIACGAVLLAAVITIPLAGQESAANGRPVVKREQPQYPELAQRMNIKGVVKVEATVEPDGSVKSVSAKGGHPLLVNAAQEAIKHWRWQPESHQTVETIEIRFNPN